MRHAVIDAVIERLIIPFVAMCVVLPLLAVQHFAAERENRRRGIYR